MNPRRFLALALLLIAVLASPARAQSPRELLDRAVARFEQGRFAESLTDFDALVTLVPDQAPYLWQRGIALYYGKRYDDCRRQFESHRLVNSADVENAAWHFLCVARAESPERAKAALLPVGPDARKPMRQVYEMLRGRMTPDEVLAAAGPEAEAVFYGHLYVGLYYEAFGRVDRALEHIRMAAAERFRDAGGYMHMVAEVHLKSLARR